MDDDAVAGMTAEAAETMRQLYLAMGELTHAFGQALTGPRVSGVSSNADVAVLISLHRDGPQRPLELHDLSGLTRGGLSNVFERLEQRQLLTRAYGATDGDRRSALISLTTRGEHVADAIADGARRAIAEQFALLHHIRDLIDSISEPLEPNAVPATSRTPLEQIGAFARLGQDLAIASAASDPQEPTPAKATVVLCAAATPNGTRPRELLDLTDLSSGGVTMLLDRLEGAGLIQRTSGCAPDRRAVTVTLTDLGRRDLLHRLERAGRASPSDPIGSRGSRRCDQAAT